MSDSETPGTAPTGTVPRNILITGVSSGLGRAMALEALRRGHVVVGTVRREE